MKLSSLMFVLSLTLLASCNGGGGKGSSTEEQIVNGQGAPTQYISECKFSIENGKYMKSRILLAGEELENPSLLLIDEYYLDSKCLEIKLAMEYPVENVRKLDSSIEGETKNIKYRPYSKALVEVMNNEMLCGLHWELAEAQDVTGTSCEKDGLEAKVNIQINISQAKIKLCPTKESKCGVMTLKKQ